MILVLDLINNIKTLKKIVDKTKYMQSIKVNSKFWRTLYQESNDLYTKLRNVDLKNEGIISEYIGQIKVLDINIKSLMEYEGIYE